MGKVFKNLKHSVIPIIIVLALLVVQAMCDLSLPEYMSDIVNTGIQQKGIKHITPDEIRVDEMEKLFFFLSSDDIETVKNSYEKTKRGAFDVYKLKEDGKEKTDELDALLKKPVLIVAGLESEQGKKFVAEMMQNAAAQNAEAAQINPQTQENAGDSAAPDIFTILSMLGEEERNEAIANISESFGKLEEMGSSVVKGIAVAYIAEEYKAIGIDVDKIQYDYIFMAGLKMILFTLVMVISAIFVSLLGARIAAAYSRDLRSDVYKKVLSYSSREINKFGAASLITRSTNDIQQIQMLMIMLIRMVLYAPIIGVGAFIKVLGTGASISWIIGLAIGLLLLVIVVLLIVAMPKFTSLQKIVDKLNLVSREIVTGLPVIRAFSREEHERQRFDQTNRLLTKTNLFVNRAMTFMMPVMMLIMNGISVLIVWAGASEIDKGNMQLGDIIAFIQYAMQVIMSFLMLSMMSIMLPRSIVAAKRIAEVLKTDTSIGDPDASVLKSFDNNKKGVVEFRDVYFRYPGAEEDVLRNISFTAYPGETTAFIGSTGSGKSTLVNLIPRFFDVTGGKILVDGANIKKVKLSDLRERIGYVPQKGVLFSGTVKSNIAYANGSEQNVEYAAEIAQASDFIEESEEKYDREISQGGTNVSGGQRQRLSIARAIAKKPEIYIFDDSFSALDYKTDVKLRKALSAASKESTVLVVAQRINTVLNADRIIVLDDGEIAGIGTHKELMETCEVYRQISESQLSKEELGK